MDSIKLDLWSQLAILPAGLASDVKMVGQCVSLHKLAQQSSNVGVWPRGCTPFSFDVLIMIPMDIRCFTQGIMCTCIIGSILLLAATKSDAEER